MHVDLLLAEYLDARHRGKWLEVMTYTQYAIAARFVAACGLRPCEHCVSVACNPVLSTHL